MPDVSTHIHPAPILPIGEAHPFAAPAGPIRVLKSGSFSPLNILVLAMGSWQLLLAICALVFALSGCATHIPQPAGREHYPYHGPLLDPDGNPMTIPSWPTNEWLIPTSSVSVIDRPCSSTAKENTSCHISPPPAASVIRFKTIVIDPPWPGPGACPQFKQGKIGGKVDVSIIPYSTMTGVQCAALQIPDVATENSQLWIWATSRSMGDAFLLVQLWGFNYRGLFVWEKPSLGLGRHIRHQCEFLLWAGRPGARMVEPRNCPRQIQCWQKTRRHSEKPAAAYEMIRSLSDGPRIDIFARQSRPGFTAWGNQKNLIT